MTEAAHVERPILRWLCGEAESGASAGGLGWTYRDEAAMAAFDRPLEDPLVEKLLVAAILGINSELKTEAQARLAVATLRKTMSNPDKLTANRQTIDLLRDGAKVVLTPGEDARTVRFIAFDPPRQDLNDFTATNQYRVQGVKQCREDTVLLVNGIPLVVAEYKSYVASSKDWREAVHQLHRYQRQAPLMLTSNLFCIAGDEDEFRYGTVLFQDASKDDIERHLDTWGRWLSLYPEHHGWWNEAEAAEQHDPLEVPVKGLLRVSSRHICSTSCSTSWSSRPKRVRLPRKSLVISNSRRSTNWSTGQFHRSAGRLAPRTARASSGTPRDLGSRSLWCSPGRSCGGIRRSAIPRC